MLSYFWYFETVVAATLSVMRITCMYRVGDLYICCVENTTIVWTQNPYKKAFP